MVYKNRPCIKTKKWITSNRPGNEVCSVHVSSTYTHPRHHSRSWANRLTSNRANGTTLWIWFLPSSEEWTSSSSVVVVIELLTWPLKGNKIDTSNISQVFFYSWASNRNIFVGLQLSGLSSTTVPLWWLLLLLLWLVVIVTRIKVYLNIISPHK